MKGLFISVNFSSPGHVLNGEPKLYTELMTLVKNMDKCSLPFIKAATRLFQVTESLSKEDLVICKRVWMEWKKMNGRKGRCL